MLWSVRETEDEVIVAPVGRLEAVMCDTFLANVTSVIADVVRGEKADVVRGEKKALALDLAGVSNISPEGLRVLTLVKQAADQHHVAISLMRPTHRLRELLSISHLDTLFDIRAGDNE